jgi:hypothetical protein
MSIILYKKIFALSILYVKDGNFHKDNQPLALYVKTINLYSQTFTSDGFLLKDLFMGCDKLRVNGIDFNSIKI